MKVNELRIGNWIYLSSKKKEYQISSGHDIEEIEDSNDAEPIPLTNGWIARLGFKYSKGVGLVRSYGDVWRIEHYFYGGQGNYTDTWLLYNSTAFERKYTLIPVSLDTYYVHQLQNLYFALTGEELTVENQEQTPIPRQSESK